MIITPSYSGQLLTTLDCNKNPGISLSRGEFCERSGLYNQLIMGQKINKNLGVNVKVRAKVPNIPTGLLICYQALYSRFGGCGI